MITHVSLFFFFRYKAVVKACCLEEDFKTLTIGDETEVRKVIDHLHVAKDCWTFVILHMERNLC